MKEGAKKGRTNTETKTGIGTKEEKWKEGKKEE
jgi:hypothetical protein